MNEKQTKIIHWTAIGLMALILILQFLPYWSTPDGTASINGYIWFPESHAALTEQFRAEISSDFALHDADVLMPVLQLVFGLLSIILCKKQNIFTAICALIVGLAGVCCPFLSPIYCMGSTWILFLIASIVLTALAVILLISAIKESRRYD